MENKKLLNFLLKDLSELEVLFAEKEDSSFDKLEMEFLQTRIIGSKKLVQILVEREDQVLVEEKEMEKVIIKEEEIEKELTNPQMEAPVIEEKIPEVTVIEKVIVPEKIEVTKEIEPEPDIEDIHEPKPVEPEVSNAKDIELEEEEPVDNQNKRLGDSFLKEKSVNDLMAEDGGKLEHKLSNRPVSNIQSAIGINDRFQYIRELFDGKAEEFSKTVSEIDSMNNLKEAVNYLQQNFKWKKNETSLKFVNLVKRRFPNE